jgi:hypothetical protein
MQGMGRFVRAISIRAIVRVTVVCLVLSVQAQLLIAKEMQAAALAPDSDVLQRIQAAHGGARLIQTDFVVEATVTLQTPGGPVVTPVTILRSGGGGQHIRFNQSDGKPWDGTIPHLEPNTRRILEFVQTQYNRALPHLLKAPTRNAQIFDGGARNGTRILNMRESTGVATRYAIDTGTSRLGRMEFLHGQTVDAAGKVTPRLETYVYSDFRSVGGIAMAFKVEHYTNGVIQEELVLTSVRAAPVNPNGAAGGQRR